MQIIKRAAASLGFVLVLGVILSGVSFTFERKESTERYSKFWENPQEYDVWFIGNSHVYYAINPMELWNQQGIRSYDLAAPGAYLAQTYWTLMCALEHCQPEVLVLDPHKVNFDTKHQDSQKGTIHTGWDAIPFSLTKIKGAIDLFDTWEERLEYVCGFSIYHNRWEELGQEDFKAPCSVNKGFMFNTRIIDKSDYQIKQTKKIYQTDTAGFIYLEKIIEVCEDRGIELLLMEVPFCRSKKDQTVMNAVSNMAKEHEIPFLKLTDEGIVDYGVDYADGGHVNLFGSKKITQYMGEYLKENYQLQDGRKVKETAEKWNADYEAYLQFKLQKMQAESEIKRYVQWLSDDRYSCYLYQEKEPQGLLAKELSQLSHITYLSKEEAKERLGGQIEGEFVFFVEDENRNLLDAAGFQNGKRK